MQGVQDQCQCCKHYGVPCLQNKTNKEEVKVNNLDYATNEEKKRKAISVKPSLAGSQQLNSTTMPNLAMIPSQRKPDNKEFQVCQAKAMPSEVCIDGWTITYKEFQPQRAKRAKQQVDNDAPSNNPVENNITKGPAKRICFHCKQEGHYVSSCPRKKINNHKVVRE
jgi:hypothetical protein